MYHLEYQGVFSGNGSWGGMTDWYGTRDEAKKAAYRQGCGKDDTLSINVRYVGPADGYIVIPQDYKDWYGKVVILKAGVYPIAEVPEAVPYILDRGEGFIKPAVRPVASNPANSCFQGGGNE